MSARRRARKLPAGLAGLQARFQQAIMSGDDTVLADINDSPRESRSVLLGVYRNAYALRLVGVLRSDYERLARHLGEEFDAMARAYLAAHPSDDPNVRWFGRHLPEFLTAARSHEAEPELAELAHLERALAAAFDAADAQPLELAHLSALAPEDWPGVVFSPHPSARRLDLATNALALWRALGPGADPAGRPSPCRLAEPERLLVWRRDLAPSFRAIGYEEAMMWDEMAKGLDFAGLCEMVAMQGGEEGAAARAGAYLRGWIEARMLGGPEA